MDYRACAGKGPNAMARLAQRLRRWWRVQDAAERYLSAATDHADLERRLRALERTNTGPVLPTFNH